MTKVICTGNVIILALSNLFVAGLDFQLSTMAPFQLVFATTDSRLPIQFTVIDDDIIELTELFQLGISVPGTNPPTGYNIGDNQTAQVQIKDNEGMYITVYVLISVHLNLGPL